MLLAGGTGAPSALGTTFQRLGKSASTVSAAQPCSITPRKQVPCAGSQCLPAHRALLLPCNPAREELLPGQVTKSS